jgi:aminoacylase
MDIRISPHTDPNDILQMFNQWCRECSLPASTKLKESFNKSDNVDSSPGLQWEILNNASRKHAVTSINSTDNPWWGIFTSKLTSCSSTTDSTTGINAEIFPAATDSRFLRSLGVKAFGFSPMKNSEILLHEHNENIEVQVFIDGCTVYSHLILELANTSSFTY